MLQETSPTAMHRSLIFLILLAGPGFAADLSSITAKELPSLVSLYKEFHAQPELSLHEEQSAARVAKGLRDAGLEVTEHMGGHGVVGVLRNGDGPVILVRSDLDALPVKEQTGLPYASTRIVKDDSGREVPVMHACGHDIHMTVLIGTARALGQLRDQWSGTLIMIGQPAEERVIGARLMLRAGLFTKFPKPDKALALHCSSDMPHGTVGIVEGYALANVDSLEILVRGVGGHGSMPHLSKDPIVLASPIVLALQTIVSREVKPGDPAVVTVGSIHGGTKSNIIPDEVRLQLTLRSYQTGTREQLIASVKRITRSLAEAAVSTVSTVSRKRRTRVRFMAATFAGDYPQDKPQRGVKKVADGREDSRPGCPGKQPSPAVRTGRRPVCPDRRGRLSSVPRESLDVLSEHVPKLHFQRRGAEEVESFAEEDE